MSRFSVTRQRFLEPPDIGLPIAHALPLPEFGHPRVERIRADPEPFSHFLDRITTLRDLRHRGDPELI
jgi:hypothetical protein